MHPSRSRPAFGQQSRCIPRRQDNLHTRSTTTTRYLAQPVFHQSKRRIIPAIHRQVMGNHLREVDHLSSDRAVACPAHQHDIHCTDLRDNHLLPDAHTFQSTRNDIADSVRQGLYVACAYQHREKRRGAHQQQQRLPINHDAIHVPVAQRSVGNIAIARRPRHRSQHLSRRPEHYHRIKPRETGCRQLLPRKRQNTRRYRTCCPPRPGTASGSPAPRESPTASRRTAGADTLSPGLHCSSA